MKLPGIPCPECRGPSRVYSSRANAASLTGGLRRRRKCLSCGHRFTTTEEPLPDQAGTAIAMAAAADLGRLYLSLDGADRAALLRLARAFNAADRRLPTPP